MADKRLLVFDREGNHKLVLEILVEIGFNWWRMISGSCNWADEDYGLYLIDENVYIEKDSTLNHDKWKFRIGEIEFIKRYGYLLELRDWCGDNEDGLKMLQEFRLQTKELITNLILNGVHYE